jgi:hypothetical protein
MGSQYRLKAITTVGALRQGLQEIIEDLPIDDSLEIIEFEVHNGEIMYSLREGIVQES